MPRFSIIIPVYNGEQTIERCLNSIIRQTYTDWECIIIDDGSTDNTINLCEKLAKSDNRLKFIKNEHGGVSAARNKGLDIATGDYLAFCDADDEYMKEKLEVCYNVLINNPSINILWHGAIVYRIRENIKRIWHTKIAGTYNIKDEDDKILSKPSYDIGHVHNKIYKRSLIVDNDIKFPLGCGWAEDLLFNIEAYVRAQSITSIPNKLYKYYLDTSHNDYRYKTRLNFIKSFNNLSKKLSDDKYFLMHKAKFVKFCEQSMASFSKNVVDYVFTYVTMNDPIWLSQYNKYCPEDKKRGVEGSTERYRSVEELLKIKLRGYCENAKSFNGVVHMIVSNKEQVPDWIDTSKINIVYHEDFIPKELLPTFNSNTIELFMHNIFGLSEHYVYSCDDTFLVRPLTYDMLFDENDNIRMKFIKSDDQNIRFGYQFSWKNASDLAIKGTEYENSDYSKYLYDPQHCHTPLIRSVCERLYNENKDTLLNSCARFREKKIIAYSFYNYWMYYHNKVKPIEYDYVVCKITEVSNWIRRKIETNNNVYSICINDGNNSTEEQYRDMFGRLYRKFPYLKVKCELEL